MQQYSVLMSVYYKDNPEHLAQSIQSMLVQTYPCSQFIIVKDGVLPSSLNMIIDSYCKENLGLFTIVSLERNKGLGYALDIGLTYSRYEIVARMDADDISLPERCEKQMQCFENDDTLCIVGAQINEFLDSPENVISSRQVPLSHDDIVKFARRRSPFNHPTVMYKKSAVVQSGGYGLSKRKEDLKLFPAMVNKGFKALNIPEVLLLYRTSKENARRRKTWLNCKEYIAVIYSNYKDGYCSFGDFLFVLMAQIVIFISPLYLVKFVTKTLLRRGIKNK